MDLSSFDLNSTADPNISHNVSGLVHQTNAGVASQYGQDSGKAYGLLNQPNGFNSSMGYGDKVTSDAIKSRYMVTANAQANDLKLENMRNASTDHLRNLQSATAAAGMEVEDNRRKALLRWKISHENSKARGAVLGNVLGIVGGVVGGVAGGFASGGAGAGAGAMAGYQLGQGVGQSVGGG